MGPHEIRQAEIEAKRNALIQEYPVLWHRMISEWEKPSGEDRAWLIYSANYLFRTQNIRWAIDPYTLHARLSDAPVMDTARDLAGLSMVLLTHRHADHLDFPTLYSLRNLPIQWVVPEFLLPIAADAGISMKRVHVPKPNHIFEYQGMKVLAFEASHFNRDASGELHGVPEMGYLVEVNGLRWLFPGDTRDYGTGHRPEFGPVDILFAHLWLGRRGSLIYPPPLLDEFCQYFLAFQPRRIILTHLEEVGRNAHSYWNQEHSRLTAARLTQMEPSISVESAGLGQSVLLN